MHNEISELMMQALDGELDASGRETLQSHVQWCGECAGEWAALSQMHESLLASAPLPAPAGFAERVQSRLAAGSLAAPAAAFSAGMVGRLPLPVGELAGGPVSAGWRVLHGVVAAGMAAAAAVLAYGPLTEWLAPESWAAWVESALALGASAAAWLELIATFARVSARLLGEGPLTVMTLVMLALTLIWIRAVTGLAGAGRAATLQRG